MSGEVRSVVENPTPSAERVDESSVELTLAPPVQSTPDVPGLRKPLPRLPLSIPEPDPDPVRFSLRELLLVITVAAVLLAPIRLVGAAMFAAVAGVIAFLVLIYLSVAKPSRGIVHVAWWVLLAIYVVAAVAALVNKDL